MMLEDTRTRESKEVKYKQDIANMVSMVMEFRYLWIFPFDLTWRKFPCCIRPYGGAYPVNPV